MFSDKARLGWVGLGWVGGTGEYNCGICESYYEPVFRCSITVLRLSDETFSRIVIGFAFSTIHAQISSAHCVLGPFLLVERV
jgi:hypothetical protein